MELEPTISVFVENPAGATTKVHHDEVLLEPLFEEPVGAPFPFAYGFVVGVPSGDGDCLDCFVLSEKPRERGVLIDCVPIAYLEQYQNEFDDHDILAVPADEIDTIDTVDLQAVVEQLRVFLGEVFSHDPERTLRVGELYDAGSATALIAHLTSAAANPD